MRFSMIAAAAVAVVSASSVFAAPIEFDNVPAVLRSSTPIGEPIIHTAVIQANAVYSNVDNIPAGSNVYLNGGAALVASVRTTKLVMDKVTMAPASSFVLGAAAFSIANLNSAAVSARYRIRFYAADGAAGAPGTVIAAVSFAAFSNPGASLNLYTADFTANNITLPSTFWVGALFDNSGATGTTLAQLNNLGQALADPPVIGSSDNTFMWSSTAANTGLAANPAGGNISLTAPAPSNLAFEFAPVPEPTMIGMLPVACLLVARRRK